MSTGDINVVISRLDAALAEAQMVKTDIDGYLQQIAALTQERDDERAANQPLRDRVAALEAVLVRVKQRGQARMDIDAASVDGQADVDDVASVGL